MTSMPASRRARAMIFAPRSWPSRPGLATTTRIFLEVAMRRGILVLQVALHGLQALDALRERRVRGPQAAPSRDLLLDGEEVEDVVRGGGPQVLVAHRREAAGEGDQRAGDRGRRSGQQRGAAVGDQLAVAG